LIKNDSDTVLLNSINWQDDDNGYHVDPSLKIAAFESENPGVHAFYDSNAANDQLFNDFGL
jgi:hypothetical protein